MAAHPNVHVSRPNLPQPDVEDTYENQPIEVAPAVPIEAEASDTEVEHVPQIPIDTTAELLGRAKPRKPRARAQRPALASAPKKAAAKKPAARKSTRGKKAPASHSDDFGNR